MVRTQRDEIKMQQEDIAQAWEGIDSYTPDITILVTVVDSSRRKGGIKKCEAWKSACWL